MKQKKQTVINLLFKRNSFPGYKSSFCILHLHLHKLIFTLIELLIVIAIKCILVRKVKQQISKFDERIVIK